MTPEEHVGSVKQAQDDHKNWIIKNQQTHLTMVTAQVNSMSESLDKQTELAMVHEENRVAQEDKRIRGDVWLHFTRLSIDMSMYTRKDMLSYADDMTTEFFKRFGNRKDDRI